MMANEKKGNVLVAEKNSSISAWGHYHQPDLHEVVARGQDPSQVKVSEIMIPATLIVIDLDASTHEGCRTDAKA